MSYICVVVGSCSSFILVLYEIPLYHRPQFVRTFTFWKSIWVVPSFFNHKQCCNALSGACLLGEEHVFVPSSHGIFGRQCLWYSALYKIMPKCGPIYTCTRIIGKILLIYILFNTWCHQTSIFLPIHGLQDDNLVWSWYVFPQLKRLSIYLYLYWPSVPSSV